MTRGWPRRLPLSTDGKTCGINRVGKNRARWQEKSTYLSLAEGDWRAISFYELGIGPTALGLHALEQAYVSRPFADVCLREPLNYLL